MRTGRARRKRNDKRKDLHCVRPLGCGQEHSAEGTDREAEKSLFLHLRHYPDARPGEQDGVHYHFISVDEFRDWISRDEFLEYAEYVGNFYGTPKKYVDAAMDRGDDVILDIEVQVRCRSAPNGRRPSASSSPRPPGRSWNAGSPAGAPTRRRIFRAASSGPRWSSRPPIPTITSSSTTPWKTPSGSWTPSSRRSTASPPTGWRSSGGNKRGSPGRKQRIRRIPA